MLYREYNFPTLFQSYFRNNEYKKIETNKIKLNSDKLIIATSIEEKSKGLLKVNNYSNKENEEKEFSLDEISYVKKKSVWFHYMLCLISVLIFIGIYDKVDLNNKQNILNIGNLPNDIRTFSILFIATIVISYIIAFFIGAPSKQIEIKFKNKEKISFFYYTWNRMEAKSFLEDLKYFNVSIKIKDINKRNNIIITILILFIVFSLNNKYIEISKESQLIKALIENTCYTDITMEKGTLIKSEKTLEKNGIYPIFKNTYLLEKSKDKIVIKQTTVESKNEDYNIFILKYFSKDSNQLIDTKYVPVKQRNYEILSFKMYNKAYYYENSGDEKIYEFNIPNYDFSKESNYSDFLVDFYNTETKSLRSDIEGQIYNFVHSNLDEQKFDTNKKFKKLGKYESKYGTCNIIQGINILYNGETDYYNVIENKNGNHLVIILTFRGGFGVGYNNYIDYFKTILPER